MLKNLRQAQEKLITLNKGQFWLFVREIEDGFVGQAPQILKMFAEKVSSEYHLQELEILVREEIPNQDKESIVVVKNNEFGWKTTSNHIIRIEHIDGKFTIYINTDESQYFYPAIRSIVHGIVGLEELIQQPETAESRVVNGRLIKVWWVNNKVELFDLVSGNKIGSFRNEGPHLDEDQLEKLL